MSTMMPLQVDCRVLARNGTIIGLTYLDDGFHPTVPCPMPGCYQPANLLLYEIREGGHQWRRCRDHCPEEYREFVRHLAETFSNMWEGAS
jgi:hypothetical protein